MVTDEYKRLLHGLIAKSGELVGRKFVEDADGVVVKGYRVWLIGKRVLVDTCCGCVRIGVCDVVCSLECGGYRRFVGWNSTGAAAARRIGGGDEERH